MHTLRPSLFCLLTATSAGAQILWHPDTTTLELLYVQTQIEKLGTHGCVEPWFARVCLKGHSLVFEMPGRGLDADKQNERCSVFIGLYAEEKNSVARVFSSVTSDCPGFLALPKSDEKIFVAAALYELTKWISAVRSQEI